MIEAICDKCGKKVTLTHSKYGLENPPGWVIKTAYRPIQADYDYRVFCHDCNPDIPKDQKSYFPCPDWEVVE